MTSIDLRKADEGVKNARSPKHLPTLNSSAFSKACLKGWIIA
jgi:hypothetical protein